MKKASLPDSRTLGIFGRSVGLLAEEKDESMFQADVGEIRPIHGRGFEIPLVFAKMGSARLLMYVVAVGSEPGPLQTPTIPMRAGGCVG